MRILFLLCFFVSTCFSSFRGQLKAILKLDDLSSLNGGNSFKIATDYLAEKKIKSGLGIIGNRIDNKSKNTLMSLINMQDAESNDVFEIWHHGYDHVIPEFKDHDYQYQKLHLSKGDKSVLDILGIQMNTFGAPGNAIDSITTQVLKEDPDYHVFFFNWIPDPNPNETLIILNQRVDMENGTGNVDYAYFVQKYQYYKPFFKDYIVLQAHPNVWKDAQLEEFKKIINYLQGEGVEFVLPNDYYLSKRELKAPVIINAVQTTDDNVVIEWENKDNINNYYRIERSRDKISWRRVNKQYSDAFAKNKYNDNISYSLADKEVYYRIRINGDVDNVLYSNVVKVGLLARDSFFRVLTNPFKDSFDFKYKFSKPGTVNLMIYNSEGKLVEQFKDNYSQEDTIVLNKIDIRKLPVGMYVYTFSFNNKVISQNQILKN